MVDRPSPAASIYPHLISGKPAEPERRYQATSPLAESMYPSLVKKPPTPSEVRDQWREHMLSLMGLRRKC
jgi:hypothetical protein